MWLSQIFLQNKQRSLGVDFSSTYQIMLILVTFEEMKPFFNRKGMIEDFHSQRSIIDILRDILWCYASPPLTNVLGSLESKHRNEEEPQHGIVPQISTTIQF